MGPNDVELVRLYTKEAGATVLDVTFPDNSPFEIVIEAEAGIAAYQGGLPYTAGVVVRDLTDNTTVTPIVSASSPSPASGSINTWPDRRLTCIFQVPAVALANKTDHICEALAFLRVGAQNPDVSFATSPMFMITPP